jgi:hypothetical protein
LYYEATGGFRAPEARTHPQEAPFMPLLLHHGPVVSEPPGRSFTDRFESLIVVLPTKRRIRHLSREVMTSAGAVPALPFHTLESLACSIYGAIDGVPQIIGGAIQTLLFSTAIRESAQRLQYFKLRGKEKQPFRGTFEKIIDVITNLKESGISPATLREEAAAGPTDEQAKLLDMAVVYEAYEEHLALLHADDLAGVYRFLSSRSTQQQFETAFRSLFPFVASVSLAGFDEFTQPQIGFINRICSIPALSVSLLFDFLPGNRGLF